MQNQFNILNGSNIYTINLYQHLNLMYRLGNSNILAIFNYIVKKPVHKYSTKFLSLNYTLRKYYFTNSRFQVFLKFHKIHRITLFLGSLFHKIGGFQPTILLKQSLTQVCSKVCKIFRNSFFIEEVSATTSKYHCKQFQCLVY